MSGMVEKEDEALDWLLVAAHHVHRMWTTQSTSIAHWVDGQLKQHERVVEERTKKHLNHAALSSTPVDPLSELPAPVLPTPPTVPAAAEGWFAVSPFSEEVQRLVDSAELSVRCISAHSVAHPLSLFCALEALVDGLVRHSLHALALPSLALQLHLVTVVTPCPPLAALVHLRMARVADALGMEEQWRLQMEEGDNGWKPRKEDVDAWELLARERERDERIRQRAQRAPYASNEAKEETKEDLSPSPPPPPPPSSLPTLSSSPTTPWSTSSPWCPAPSLPFVYLQTAELMLSFGRHTEARVLASLAYALAVPLADQPSFRLHSLLGMTPSSCSLSSLVATAENVGEFRRAFGQLLSSVRGSGDVARRRGRLVEEVRRWGEGRGVFGQRCAALAQALQAQCVLDDCTAATLILPLPVTGAVLHSLQLHPSSTSPPPHRSSGLRGHRRTSSRTASRRSAAVHRPDRLRGCGGRARTSAHALPAGAQPRAVRRHMVQPRAAARSGGRHGSGRCRAGLAPPPRLPAPVGEGGAAAHTAAVRPLLRPLLPLHTPPPPPRPRPASHLHPVRPPLPRLLLRSRLPTSPSLPLHPPPPHPGGGGGAVGGVGGAVR